MIKLKTFTQVPPSQETSSPKRAPHKSTGWWLGPALVLCFASVLPLSAGESGEVQPGEGPSEDIQSGESYALRMDAPIELGSTAQGSPELTLRWLELNDSRCPEGLQCFVAGQAQLRLEVCRAGHDPEEVILVLAAGRRLGKDDAEATLGRFHVELLSVEPYPEAGKAIPERDRWATLAIRRQGETEKK